MKQRNTTPPGYPSSSVSDIHDAQAFTVGNGVLVHSPWHYPNGLMVVARCGVYGFTTERDGSRQAAWADSLPTCPRCKDK